MTTIPDLQKIFNKHKISSVAQTELKNAFEQMIVQAFYQNLNGTKTSINTANIEDREGKCHGKCYIGTAKEKFCPNKAIVGNYCKRHDPDKTSTTNAKPKKKHDNDCNGIIKKTKKQCSSSGTVQPDGAEFHYCKRHSEKWKTFEETAKIDED